MTDENKDPGYFRAIIGYLCILGSLAGFGGLYFIEVPPENDKAMMFALGIIFQWGSNVVSSEYGVTTTGRKVAESAIRKIERADIAVGETPVDPIQAEIVNTPDKPANVKETKI